MSEDILETIDNALEDWSVSHDAMRWTPEPAEGEAKDETWLLPPGGTFTFDGDGGSYIVRLWTADGREVGQPRRLCDPAPIEFDVPRPFCELIPPTSQLWIGTPADLTAPTAAELVAGLDERSWSRINELSNEDSS